MSEEAKIDKPTEAEKKAEETQAQPDGGEAAQKEKTPEELKREKQIQEILEKIEAERNEMNQMQRFGYFSIPFPAIVGDEAYSHNYEPKHKIVEGKVVTEKRGIFTKPPKKGKTPDVYFMPIEPLTEEQIEFLKKCRDEDRQRILDKVREKRETKEVKAKFKPAGPQVMFGFYNEEPGPVPDGQLYYVPDKKRFIMEGGKVKTENRGIFTNPTKMGFNLNPGDYFSYYRSIDELDDRIKDLRKQDYDKKMEMVKSRKENKSSGPKFKPASLKKNDPFASNIETYGLYNDQEKEELMNEYKKFKKDGRPKYVKELPKGALKHMQPFKLARLVATGRDGLFNDNLYTLPEPTDKDKPVVISVRERKEKEAAEAKNKRMPFTYNKLMKHSTFSPSINSFRVNLKRDFPNIKFH